MSQQKRPHKRYTPKFFHCDDVPRQTTSSDMPELVSVTENSFSNECRPHQAGKHTERVLEQRGERDSRVRVRVAIAWSARWLAVYAMSGSKAMASKLARIDHHTADYHLKEDRGFAAQAEAAKAIGRASSWITFVSSIIDCRSRCSGRTCRPPSRHRGKH